MLLKSLETLALRVGPACGKCRVPRRLLESSPDIAGLRYLGLRSHTQHELAKRQMSYSGTLLSFTLTGGKDKAFRVLKTLRLIDISNNFGDSKTLACHLGSTTHSSISAKKRAGLG